MMESMWRTLSDGVFLPSLIFGATFVLVAPPTIAQNSPDYFRTLSTAELNKRIKEDFTRELAILELGRRRDRSVLPLLEGLAKNQKASVWARHRAKIDLARLNVPGYFESFEAGLSSDGPAKIKSIAALGEIGGKRAIGLLISHLDDKNGYLPEGANRPSPGVFRKDAVRPMPYGDQAADALQLALPDVFRRLFGDEPTSTNAVREAWKQWWRIHGADPDTDPEWWKS